MLALAGCGGTSALAKGKRVFSTTCAGCHTITGHNTNVTGGDLGIEKLSTADIASFVHVMPVRITPAEAAEVAAYVHYEETRLGSSP